MTTVTTAVPSRTHEARELALRLTREKPGIQQRDLVPAIQGETDLANSTITRLLQRMERDGELKGLLDGRRKAYALPSTPARTRAEPPAAAPAPAKGSRGELVALVSALFIAAALVAFVLAPDKGDSSGGRASAAPAVSPAPPPPAPTRSETPAKPKAKPKPKPRRRAPSGAALAAAKRTQVAVLSGSAVPGIAAKTGAALKRKGFKVGTVGNAPGPSTTSVVLYARGKKNAAHALGRSIKIAAVKPADPASQAIDPKAGLLVVVGADRRR